jgi:hypothetical protein
VAVFNYSERLPLPPTFSTESLPGEQTEVFNIREIKSINRRPVESDGDCAPATILATNNWLNWNWDLDNPNDS